MIRLKTDKEYLVFVGFDGFEEYYLDLSSDLKGWSFMGLRPDTEKDLREYARETTPGDLGFNIPPYMENYFDWESWREDQENDWFDRHDVQAERENEKGETLYLGFGSGTDIFHYFRNNGIYTYKDFVEHFEEVGITEDEFNVILTEDADKIKEVLGKINQ
jgi:hypothetical protein